MSRDPRNEPRDPQPRDDERTRTSSRDGPAVEDRQPERIDRRQPVVVRDRTFRVRDSELRMLETIGTFRVVPESDLSANASDRATFDADLRSLSEQRLVDRDTATVDRRPTAVRTLTNDGKRLLETRRDPADRRPQTYHAGLVKPRELAHDAKLHRLFQSEARRLEAQGARVLRVLLDHEIKRDYQAFLNRPDHTNLDDDRSAFAATHHLTVVHDHLEIPDLRIEYETEDGRLEHRDLELVTEHYSRSQLAGKRAAGFTMYRAAGQSRRGGTPHDPHLLERLL